MMWHVVFTEQGGLPQSRAARSRDAAIQTACELLARSYDVRRILEPSGSAIERVALDEHCYASRSPRPRDYVARHNGVLDIPTPPRVASSSVKKGIEP